MPRYITEREWRHIQRRRAIGDACFYVLCAVVLFGAFAILLRYPR